MAANVNAYSTNQQTRGSFLKNIGKAASATIATSQILTTNPQASDAASASSPDVTILRAGGKCAYGVGEGCDELSGGNEYIKELQRKSAASKEQAQQEYLSAYQMKNYPEFFASLNPPKYMVKQPDGSIKLYEEEELSNLKKAGKIKLEIPRAMGGRVTDLTQKPILVLIE
jgi:hypothetical protein